MVRGEERRERKARERDARTHRGENATECISLCLETFRQKAKARLPSLCLSSSTQPSHPHRTTRTHQHAFQKHTKKR